MTDRSSEPPYLLALRMSGEQALVVGGGRVAARKVASLVECAAVVTVVAPITVPDIDRLAPRVLHRRYRTGDVDGFRLVIAATGEPAVDRRVFADAEEASILVNAADLHDACRFFVPAVLRRGPVSVAVSTGGTSPALASWLKTRLADFIGPEIGEVALLLGEVRAAVRSAGLSTEGLAWSELLDQELVSAVTEGRLDEAQERASRWLEAQLAQHTNPERRPA
jgi:precorrin-2 dehydrogenase/sirohydrochlorin ferrochelatase